MKRGGNLALVSALDIPEIIENSDINLSLWTRGFCSYIKPISFTKMEQLVQKGWRSIGAVTQRWKTAFKCVKSQNLPLWPEGSPIVAFSSSTTDTARTLGRQIVHPPEAMLEISDPPPPSRSSAKDTAVVLSLLSGSSPRINPCGGLWLQSLPQNCLGFPFKLENKCTALSSRALPPEASCRPHTSCPGTLTVHPAQPEGQGPALRQGTGTEILGSWRMS